MANTLFSASSSVVKDEMVNSSLSPWLVLVIDDEADVHSITKMTMRDFIVDNRPIEILSAYSKAEGMIKCQENPGIALAIVDVVMETDHAGLELIDYIRNDLDNHKMRIVLRTGQSGQAPESDVISQYDINDYKSKTELTSQKLKTLFFSAIRSYRDIETIERSRVGIHNVLEATSTVLKSSTLANFANAVLEQIIVLQGCKSQAVFASTFPNKTTKDRQEYFLAATSGYRQDKPIVNYASLPHQIKDKFDEALKNEKSIRFSDGYVAYLKTPSGHQNVLAVITEKDIGKHDLELLELYCSNVSLTYEMLLKNEDMVDVQRQLVFLLGEAVESRSKETGAHVKRVSIISEAIALAYGLSADEAEVIRYASPLHDVGKIAIPDKILNKPGKLEGEDWEIMKEHAQIGANILSNSPQLIFQVASEIAGGHHERWDGNGYPKGLKGTDIPISARIVALADIFDALGSKRCYKAAWRNDDILTFIKEQSGQIFDPDIANILINRFDFFVNVRVENPDQG